METSEDDFLCDSASDSDSDCSWKSYSPITSDDEFSDPDSPSSGSALDTTADNDGEYCETSSFSLPNLASDLPVEQPSTSQTQQTSQEQGEKSSQPYLGMFYCIH